MTSPKYVVSLTSFAEADLQETINYFLVSRAVAQAEKLIDAIEKAKVTLETFPQRGSIPHELHTTGLRNIRQIIQWPHRILYMIQEFEVDIVAIVDGRRDIKSLLLQRLMKPPT